MQPQGEALETVYISDTTLIVCEHCLQCVDDNPTDIVYDEDIEVCPYCDYQGHAVLSFTPSKPLPEHLYG